MFVLPPQSTHLLLKLYAKLMTDIASPLLSYCPIELSWTHMVLPTIPRLPVFDVDYAKSILKPARLTAVNKLRNTIGKLVKLTSLPQHQWLIAAICA